MSAPKHIRQNYQQLQKELKHHAHLYHALDAPIISDAEYDRLYRQLQEYEQRYPELKQSDSVTREVGAKTLKRFPGYTHHSPVLSLKNGFTSEHTRKFIHDSIQRLRLNDVEISPDKLKIFCEPKLDGMSMCLIYSRGRLEYAVTRGDGIEGEVVTANAKRIADIPHQVKTFAPYDRVEVRGEVIIQRADFARMKDELKKQGIEVANPRNFAAGTVRQLDPEMVAGRPLRFFAFRLMDPDLFNIARQDQAIEFLNKRGFNCAIDHCRLCQGEPRVTQFFQHLKKMRHTLPFDADGLVLKLNSLPAQRQVGLIDRQAPRWALALKFPVGSQTSVIEGITWQVARSGIITPVAELQAIQLEGAEVRRATLVNYSNIIRKDIRIGDTVEVRRAGGVIPEVVRVIIEGERQRRNTTRWPGLCPDCAHPTQVSISAHNIQCHCPNWRACPMQIINRLVHFCSREGMEIEGLSSAILEDLYQFGLIADYADIYRLHRHAEDLYQKEGYGVVSVDDILAAIERSKQNSMERLVYALGIPHLGELRAARLTRLWNSLRRFVEDILSVHALEEIDISFAADERVYRFLSRLDHDDDDQINDRSFEEIESWLKRQYHRYRHTRFARHHLKRIKRIIDSDHSLEKLPLVVADLSTTRWGLLINNVDRLHRRPSLALSIFADSNSSKTKPDSAILKRLQESIQLYHSVDSLRIAFEYGKELSAAAGKNFRAKLKALDDDFWRRSVTRTLPKIEEVLADTSSIDASSDKHWQTVEFLWRQLGSVTKLARVAEVYHRLKRLKLSHTIIGDLAHYFEQMNMSEILEELESLGLPTRTQSDSSESTSAGALAEYTILVTGTFDDMTRVEVQKLCRDNGATIAKSFTNAVNLLLCGENPGKTKWTRAQSRRVEIWRQSDLKKRLAPGYRREGPGV